MLGRTGYQGLGIVAGFCLRLGGSQLGEPEVENLGVTALGYEEVGGLDVAMHNAMVVCSIQRVSNFNGEPQ